MAALTIGVAMSGGVDSTMAASLLLEAGHRVHGFHMLLPLAEADLQRRRAQQAADRLSIPLTVIDLRRPFAEQVIGYFTGSYRSGQTPNPCILCNATIKFGLFAQAMMQHKMARIATGHYARITIHHNRPFLSRGLDPGKDQSYFLARLAPGQLHATLFPLGESTKAQMYARAGGMGMRFEGQESQDVCFLTDGLSALLAEHGLGEQTGPVVTIEGRQIGEHRGIWHYTIGQRRGLGLPDATPWYVVRLDGKGNRVVVGKQEDLFARRCTLQALQWTYEPLSLPWNGLVQLRSRHAPALAELTVLDSATWQLDFAAPQRAITPGQFAVLYEDDRVVGSAVIGTSEEQS